MVNDDRASLQTVVVLRASYAFAIDAVHLHYDATSVSPQAITLTQTAAVVPEGPCRGSIRGFQRPQARPEASRESLIFSIGSGGVSRVGLGLSERMGHAF